MSRLENDEEGKEDENGEHIVINEQKEKELDIFSDAPKFQSQWISPYVIY